MSVVINPVVGKYKNNWIQLGSRENLVDLAVSWDDKSALEASSVLKDEYEKLGGKTDLSGLYCLITKVGEPNFTPFRAWVQVKLAN